MKLGRHAVQGSLYLPTLITVAFSTGFQRKIIRNAYKYMRFEVLPMVNMKFMVFWDVRAHSVVKEINVLEELLLPSSR
jgi:hypothetical protein